MKLEDLLRFIKVREVVFVVGWFIEMILLNNENVGNDLNGDIKCEKCDGWVEIHFPEIPNIIKVETSWLYFRVKLSCVCLLFASRFKKRKERKKENFTNPQGISSDPMVTIMTQSCPLPTLRLPIVIYGDHKVISCDPNITAKTKISVSSRSRFKF